MKNYFTKEQIEKLKVAEHHFLTVVKENYKRGTMRDLNDFIADEYEKATGEKLNRNWNCNTCCLNNYRIIGNLYFESIKYLEEQETATVPEKPEEPVKVEKNLSEGAEHTEAQEPVSGTESTENNGVSDTVSKYLETEPAPKKAAPKKKVANNNTDQEQNTQETSVPDDTQKVQKRNKATQTKSKGFDTKSKTKKNSK